MPPDLFRRPPSFRLVTALASEFPDSGHVRLLGLDTASEEEIWAYAAGHGFAIVTKDEDFANRAALIGPPPQVVWLRIGNTSYHVSLAVLRRHIVAVKHFVAEGTGACLELYP